MACSPRQAANPIGETMTQADQKEKARQVAVLLDSYFNGEARGFDRKVGFVLLVFPYSQVSTGCNYITNGAERKDMVVLFKELIKRFEGQPEIVGHA